VSKIGHNFPPPDELPIPEDVQPGDGWTERMLEMADHIGPYRTLLLVDRFGGMRIYIPADWTKGKVYEGRGSIRQVAGDEAARILSDIYRREYIVVPTAKAAVARARRGAVIASVRQGDMSGAGAAKLLGTSRTYLSHLVNQTDEGLAPGETPRSSHRHAGQPDLFGEE
jgi:hypothetical protein